MANLTGLHTAAGQTISLGKEIGDGGEGIVFAVEGSSHLAAKLYREDKRASRADKVAAMTAAGWHATARNVAFPIETLFDQNGRFIGFTMRRVGGHQPIHNLYSPTSRKTAFPNTNNFRFLLRTAANIARSLANVHHTGCVVGDINHSGILIAHDATATWIDCDSFQVSVGGRLFHCAVGTPEFTPPELQDKPFDRIIRTVDHDAFGLAVIIFNLLFMGRHPFAGRFLSAGDMPPEKAIAEFRFAYSARTGATHMMPPPGVPLLTDIPPDMRDAFETAFGPAGAWAGRPKAADWVGLIEAAEKQVIACKSSAAHHYFSVAPSCPWCRMEAAYPGFVAFTAVANFPSSNPATLGDLIAAIRAAPDPRSAPSLAALMPAFQGQPSAASTAAHDAWMGAYVVGILGALVSFELMHLPALFPAVGVIVFVMCAALACRPTDLEGSLKRSVARGKLAWQAMEQKWKDIADNRSWTAARREADELIQKLQRLGSEEANRIAGLKTTQRMHQLRLYLERHPISHGAIKGVGDSRKATLRSYGIETAADIERARIESISGFGPAIAGTLLDWRASLERKFVFDASRPIDPADVAAIKSDIARQAADIEKRLRQSLSNLQQSAASVASVRASLKASAVNVWHGLKQGEIDEAAVRRRTAATTSVRRGIFAALCVIGFLAVHAVNSSGPASQSVPQLAPAKAAADDLGECSKGSGDEAVAACRRVLMRNPEDAAAYYNRGAIYFNNGDYDRAIADYDQAIRIDPKDAFVYTNRGNAYGGKGNYDRAIANYDQAIRIDPKNAVAYYNRGTIYFQKADYDRAIADYDQAIRIDPKYAVAFYNRGSAHFNKHDYDRAVADYDQALILDPNDASARSYRERAQRALVAQPAPAKSGGGR
jgi:DNA-binding helix-hairpin-helix protein with protein kinase domain/Tfp pilus assembly protein PilF